jgi:hypothetical protein
MAPADGSTVADVKDPALRSVQREIVHVKMSSRPYLRRAGVRSANAVCNAKRNRERDPSHDVTDRIHSCLPILLTVGQGKKQSGAMSVPARRLLQRQPELL